MKKRCCIFVFYNSEGEVGQDVRYLVQELRKISHYLIIVVNGRVKGCGKDYFEKNANLFIVRENVGYDAGAYADVIHYHLKDSLFEYDELIFCNDTFIGPFLPFDQIFNKMELLNYDFWGIDKVERGFMSYVIPYFCVFNSSIICSNNLVDYFEDNIYGKVVDRADVYARFEVGLTYFLRKKYKVGSFISSNGFLSCSTPEICIDKYNLPIIKKKFFTEKYFSKKRYEDSIQIIKQKYEYDISYIEKYFISTKEYRNILKDDIEIQKYSIPDVKDDEIIEFISSHNNLYIWGAGLFAKATWFVYKDYFNNFMGYIESEPKTNVSSDGNIINRYDDVGCAPIIIAADKKNTMEILREIIQQNDVLSFWKI